MLHIAGGIFIILHGLVHLWYVVLSQGLVEFEAEMGWTGQSWLLSSLLAAGPLRTLATGLYVVATAAFVVTGVGLFVRAGWWQTGLLASAVLSSAAIVLFWDGSGSLLVQKGLLGLLINVAAVVVVLATR